MFFTNYGSFDGNSWEDMFQIILKRKFMDVGYQKVKASPGDFGIEGYTMDGRTFQCYCPSVNLDSKTYYEKQRTKITEDINKLNVNRSELTTILGGVKLNRWILISPSISHRDLITHCNKKRDLVKSWNLPFVDNDKFQVHIHEADDYAIEIGEYFNYTGKRFSITPKKEEASNEKMVEWKTVEVEMVGNALEKNRVRITSLYNQDVDRKVNLLTNDNIMYYLKGESMLQTWQSTQPENHQRFIELLASVEEELREKCLLNVVDPNAFVKEIGKYVEEKIQKAFPYLDESTILRLRNYSTAFWLLSCPLYFEMSDYES